MEDVLPSSQVAPQRSTMISAVQSTEDYTYDGSPDNLLQQACDVTDTVEDDGEKIHNTTTELVPGSGVQADRVALWKGWWGGTSPQAGKIVGELMMMIFTATELENSSITGRTSNILKKKLATKNLPPPTPKAKLDEVKLTAIKNYAMKTWQIGEKEFLKYVGMKLNNMSKGKIAFQ